jgi:hypothetical protein
VLVGDFGEIVVRWGLALCNFPTECPVTGCLECYCKAGELSEVSSGALVLRCSRRAEFQDVPLGYLLRVVIRTTRRKPGTNCRCRVERT